MTSFSELLAVKSIKMSLNIKENLKKAHYCFSLSRKKKTLLGNSELTCFLSDGTFSLPTCLHRSKVTTWPLAEAYAQGNGCAVFAV